MLFVFKTCNIFGIKRKNIKTKLGRSVLFGLECLIYLFPSVTKPVFSAKKESSKFGFSEFPAVSHSGESRIRSTPTPANEIEAFPL
jgi:hypothetical protein